MWVAGASGTETSLKVEGVVSRDHIRELCADTWYPTWECKVSGWHAAPSRPLYTLRFCDRCLDEIPSGRIAFDGMCWSCHRETIAAERADRKRAYQRAYYLLNREQIRARQAGYRARRRERTSR